MKKPTAIAVGLTILAALGLGRLVANRAVVHAAGIQTEVAGSISEQPDEQIVLDDGLATYYLVSAMDVSSFLGSTVVLQGGLDQETFYVTNLVFGAIAVHVQDGRVTIDVTGTVDQVEAGYQVTVEGITFSLYGPGLDQFVGQPAQIHGDLIGRDVTVTEIT